MKIVHVVYNMDVGGAEMLVAQLCRRQRENGHTVEVCTYDKLGTLGEVLRTEGFAVHTLGEAPVPKTMLRYWRHFRRERPDVVHCHNPAPTLQAAMGARLVGVSCVMATRHSLVSPPYNRVEELKFNVWAWLWLDWVVGICEMTCENLRGAPLARRGKIVRVYNGTTALERTPVKRGDGEFHLLFVGRLAKIKDLGTLLRAVAIAAERIPQVRLDVVGDGPVRGELEELARELGSTERFRFHGQQLETARFFSRADAFVMSSISEGLPMSLLQAMSLGLPAVLTDVGGMHEVLERSGSGLLTPVGDAAAMAEAIVRLATDDVLRAKFSQRAVATYQAEFTLERMDAEYMRLYRAPENSA